MNPNANTPVPLSPEESYLASRLFGKSLFSAIQLAKEQERHDRARMSTSDILRIPMPAEVLKQGSEKVADSALEPSPGVIGRALRFNRNPIRALVGGDHGFNEGKREYFDMERAQIMKELEAAQKEYLGTLQRIKQGSETPLLDSFCSGIATESTLGDVAEKVAGDTAETVDISDGAIRRIINNILHRAKSPIQPALDLGATGLAATGAGTGYLTYNLKKKMRENGGDYGSQDLPTRVELEPYRL